MLVAQSSLGPVCPVPLTVRGIECRVDGLGGWHKGRVVKHWYRESDMPPGLFMPYQIELDREHDRGKLICANHDDDRMIRRAID